VALVALTTALISFRKDPRLTVTDEVATVNIRSLPNYTSSERDEED
jgi:hypothetical protein